jgi:carbamoyltransferase
LVYFTYYCGFKVNSGEYKLMGLAPYGHLNSKRVNDFVAKIKNDLISLKEDGSLFLSLEYFDFATGLKMCRDEKWESLFGVSRRSPEGEIDQVYMDLALACQIVTEESVLNLAKTAFELTGKKNLVMAGGVALNCVANGKILNKGLFDNIWVQPAAGDAGGSLGAALAAWHIYLGQELIRNGAAMQGAALGPEYDTTEINKVKRKFGAISKIYEQESVDQLIGEAIEKGQVVGWFQGRMEFGPRALGNRSILANPKDQNMQKNLNLKIKYREGFRPFAPAVLEEDCHNYFDLKCRSPYMLLVAPLKSEICNDAPINGEEKDLMSRLYFERSSLPAITHIDYSARVQTVSKLSNPRFWSLLNKVKDITGDGVLVNTSFNVRGEPIVCTPEDAYICFMRTEMDILVLGSSIFLKEDQPKLKESSDWKSEFPLD